MTTRMRHPEHGATHAYDTGEINRLIGLGWSVEGRPEEPAAPRAEAAPADESAPQEADAPKRKPGRPRKG